jgi:hypothetical protein
MSSLFQRLSGFKGELFSRKLVQWLGTLTYRPTDWLNTERLVFKYFVGFLTGVTFKASYFIKATNRI